MAAARSAWVFGCRSSVRGVAFAFALCALGSAPSAAQSAPPPVDESQLGAWYMYFYTGRFRKTDGSGEPSRWGVQGDAQWRNWNLAGDLEQLLLRSGLTYRPKGFEGVLTLGYASITTGQFGRDFDGTVREHRVYQEALLPHRVAGHLLLTHRFRYEQRFNDGQNFRTRYRYNLFANVPLNGTELVRGVAYVALYNELFVNGQRAIGDARSVELFDRNRTYLGLGYGFAEGLRAQLGWMLQTTDAWGKGQLQVSVHHSW